MSCLAKCTNIIRHVIIVQASTELVMYLCHKIAKYYTIQLFGPVLLLIFKIFVALYYYSLLYYYYEITSNRQNRGQPANSQIRSGPILFRGPSYLVTNLTKNHKLILYKYARKVTMQYTQGPLEIHY
jgi:hypothetical protein